jgi:uncharacterized protein (DUF885 family)
MLLFPAVLFNLAPERAVLAKRGYIMTSILKITAALLAATMLTSCVDVAATPPGATTAAQSEASKPLSPLYQLFADSDEASLKLSPISALFRGDERYAGEFGDYITDDFIAKLKANAQSDWKRLHDISRASLNAQDQIAYDVFEYQTKMALEALTPAQLALTIVRPINHFSGIHTQFPDLSSGKSAAQYKTVKDFENGLTRIDGFVTYLDRAIERMKQGEKSGVVETKLTTKQMISQFNDLIAQGVEKSPFWQPISDMPKEIADADRTRLTSAYRDAIANRIVPAFTRVRDFLKNSYLAKARSGVGLVYMKGGKGLYEFMVRDQTTTDMTADEIHNLGLKEVARIKDEMDGVRKAVNFKGSLHDFFTHLRTAKEFEPKSRDDLKERYADIEKRINAAIPQDFSLVPKTPLELRVVPDYLEQTQAGGYYNQGSPDATRPGTFFFNTYDLASRKLWGMETLFLHEAIPGHHFQISLAQENSGLPNFMRFGGNTAYVEGWALYAEWTGRELGMYKDPYQMFGHLNDEQLRALRLVVDTGIHAKGWSREKAIKYMLDNSALSVTETTQEVERYIANPGQALGYKIGQITIKRLRAEAEKELGPKFDVRKFHAQVLDTGALPMLILESKIRNWIKTQK